MATFPILMHINFHINKLMINIKEFSENRYDYKKISEYKKNQLAKFTEGFENNVYNMSLEVLTWISKMDSKVFSENKIEENMILKINDSKLKLIINGMILAYQIKNNLNYLMNTHLSEK